MNQRKLYDKVCIQMSERMTKENSTSFSLGIRMFEKSFRQPIYAIYGFVRLADEIVDTFHEVDKAYYLKQIRAETKSAIENKLSLNPILHSFQETVHKYGINISYIDAFLDSMEMDLTMTRFNLEEYKKYIYGSAEVVGLMCLKVFVKGDEQRFEELKQRAQSLGSAFQKINFLRDLKSDFDERGRIYFPGITNHSLSDIQKASIEQDILVDFKEGLEGIKQLPVGAKLGVYLAFRYYYRLYLKISTAGAFALLEKRFRISNLHKLSLLCKSYIRYQFNLIR